jgi:hypothetical protein
MSLTDYLVIISCFIIFVLIMSLPGIAAIKLIILCVVLLNVIYGWVSEIIDYFKTED